MKKIFTSFVNLLISAAVFGQSPALVKDINPVTADVNSSSYPAKGALANGKLYFAATDYQGREPWRTDGTSGGTIFLKDINSTAPALSSSPHDFVKIGTNVYFFTGDSSASQLWKVIGSDTVKLVQKDLVYPHDLVVTGSTLVFSGRLATANDGQELLRFDTAIGVLQSFDINPGPGSSDPRYLTVKGDSIFFSADDGTNGRELWIYDLLNVTPVTMISDINTGSVSSDPYDFVIYHDTLFFSATTDPDGTELYYSDGNVSGAGTGFFASINDINDPADSSSPSNKTVFNNKLIFSANNGIDGVEPWEYDGTTGTIAILKNINPGASSSFAGQYGFKSAGSYLYFAANDGTNGMELWKTDAVFGGTTSLVNNINSGSSSSNPQSMYNLSDTLIFVADDGNGPELWRSNGTNTAMIQNIQPLSFPNPPVIVGALNNKIYFAADNGSIGSELYVTNGLSAGTSLVKDIHHSGFGTTSSIPWLESFNSAIYFPATKDNYNESLGLNKSDATTGGTSEVVAPGGATNFRLSTVPGKAVGSIMYFRAFTTAENEELWKTDGTAVGTVLLKDIATGATSSAPNNFTAFGTKLLFTANNGTNGDELWISDGTTVGTTLLKDVRTGATGSAIQDITVVGTKAFFTADDGTNGRELWVTDGTTTSLVKNIRTGAASSNPAGLYAAGTLLYFYADDGTNGSEPWKSDGTSVGTVILSNINASGSSTNSFGNFCTLGAYTYFGADDGSGTKLWRTDGTTTSLFNSIAFPSELINIGSKIVFFCLPAGGQNGFEIYSTNGTTVTKVKDFAPYGLNYIIHDNYPVYQSNAFYWLDDNVHGQELWGTDGTTSGTIIYEVAPGPSSSYPRHAKTKGTASLLFTANDGSTKGDELWKLEFATLPVSGLDFNVQKKDGTKALLNWKTYTEFNNKGFEIQRSSDGRNFISIGFVNARGIGSNGASYEFTDASPLTGKNYYRLRQTDIDQQFTYSQVRWIDFSKEVYVKAYPNPTIDVLNITTGYNFKNATLTVRNTAGQLVKQQTVKGSGTVAIPVKGLPAGLYNVEIAEEGTIVKLMFVKQQ